MLELPIRRYHSGMDAAIAGALIGGGAAVIGFGASAWQSVVSQRAQRTAAVEQRLWEKRSGVYERVLDALTDRDTDPAIVLRHLTQEEGKVWGYGSFEVRLAFERVKGACKSTSIDPLDRWETMGELADLIMRELQSLPDPLARLKRAATRQSIPARLRMWFAMQIRAVPRAWRHWRQRNRPVPTRRELP